MLRYTTDRARPGLVALYDIGPGNGAGPFLQPRSLHGAYNRKPMLTKTRLQPDPDYQQNLLVSSAANVPPFH